MATAPPRQIPLWAFNKDLEGLCFHRVFWPTVMELLNGKPKLKGAQFIQDDPIAGHGHVHGSGGHLHCAREDWGTESATFEVDFREGQLRANDMIVFIYLTDVHEGDGGLAVLPGSHKNNFVRPPGLYGGYGMNIFAYKCSVLVLTNVSELLQEWAREGPCAKSKSLSTHRIFSF